MSSVMFQMAKAAAGQKIDFYFSVKMEGTDQTVSIYRTRSKMFLIKKHFQKIIGLKEIASTTAKSAEEEAYCLLA